MNQYLTYIFEHFTLKTCSTQFTNLIKNQLLTLAPVPLTSLYKPLTSSPLLFNQLTLLLSKGVIKYSPANCTIDLSLPNIMVYQRLFKMAYFAQEELEKGVGEFVREWVEQGVENGVGWPVGFEKKRLEKAFMFSPIQEGTSVNSQQVQQTKKKSKSKPKQQTQHKQKPHPFSQPTTQYNYHKLIYEYKSAQKSIKLLHNNQQQPQKPPTKPTRKTSKQLIIEQPQNTIESYMLNVEQLTRLMQLWVGLKIFNAKYGSKEKKLSLFEFVNHKDRQQLIQQVKYQKLQQFIAQLLTPDCLLVFNLIRTRPYITQKQLIKLTMLEVVQTRASLNKLIQKGLIYFYHQNARTIVYKVVDTQILEKKYVDTIARGMMNLALLAERVTELSGTTVGQEKVKAKLIELECEMQRLDDVLILFGW